MAQLKCILTMAGKPTWKKKKKSYTKPDINGGYITKIYYSCLYTWNILGFYSMILNYVIFNNK